MDESPIKSVFLRSVPHSPGVYLMKDPGDNIIYVGKARDLRNRLASYRSAEARRFSKTAVMLQSVTDIDTILTATEKEALLLEASLIKRHQPRYNVILRDDKNYPYLKVTVNEKWPRIMVCRRKLKDGARYFGPYSSASSMHETLALIREIFPLRTCKGSKLQHRQRPCLNQQMGKCPGPCCGLTDHRDYLEAVNNVLFTLEGRRSDLVGFLKKRMSAASEAREYEKAASFRDRLVSLSKTLEKQVVAAGHSRDQDIFGLVRQDMAAAISIVFVRQGLVNGQQSYFFESVAGNDGEVLSSCLQQFYSDDRYIPPEILLSHDLEDIDLLKDWLTEKRGKMVHLKVPQRGSLVELVLMAKNNAGQVFADVEKKTRSSRALSEALAKTLKLSRPPAIVECLDISNIGGKQAVGSLVCFLDGEPDKRRYRHYRITGLSTPDDYGMIREVLMRRLEPGRDDLPDLLLIDGGKGQLNVALQVAAETGRLGDLEIASIAKEKKEEGEKLFRPGRKNALKLPRHSPVLLFLMRIRDESHRFGITFHREMRRKDSLKSGLDLIPGIGPARRRLLLRKFGSLKKIRAAPVSELTKLEGIGAELALAIREHLAGK